MQRTTYLDLPIYNTPDVDTFNVADWNNANQTIDDAYNEINTNYQEIISNGSIGEVIDARRGQATLGAKIDVIDSQITDINTDLVDMKTKQLKFVTYEMFGASLNGVDDDSLAVYNAHTYANANGIPVKQNRGTILLKTATSILVKTDLDLSGATIKITQDMASRTIYEVYPDNNVSFNIATGDKSQFVKGAYNLPCLDGYEYYCFGITTDKNLAYRDSGSASYWQTYSEVITTSINGNVLDGGLFETFSDANTITLSGSSIFEKAVTIKVGTVVMDTTDDLNMPKLFNIARNNVTFDACSFKIVNMTHSDLTATQYKGCLIQFYRSYGSKFINCNGENFTKTLTGGDGSYYQSNYIVATDRCSNFELSNCTFTRGWGFVQTEYSKNVRFLKSTLNRVDNHYGNRNFIVRDCTIYGRIGILIGFGDGDFLIENVKFYIVNNEDYFLNLTYHDCIKNRDDCGVLFQGRLIVRDVKVFNFTSNVNTINVLTLGDTLNSNYQSMLSSYVPEIIMENIYVETTDIVTTLKCCNINIGNSNGDAYIKNKHTTFKDISIDKFYYKNGALLSSAMALYTKVYQGCHISHPSNIIVKNSKGISESDKVVYFEVDDDNTTNTGVTPLTDGSTLFILENLYGRARLHSKLANALSVNCYKSQLSFDCLASYQKVNTINMYDSKIIMNEGYITNLNLYNCTGSYYYTALKLNAYNCTLTDTQTYYGSLAGKEHKFVNTDVRIKGFTSSLYNKVDIFGGKITVENTDNPSASNLIFDPATFLSVRDALIYYNTALSASLTMTTPTTVINLNSYVVSCADSTVQNKFSNYKVNA